MRKFCYTFFVFACVSCNSTSTEDKQIKEDKKNNEVGIPNVNGNIPDTTNSINLNTHKKDSTGMDSVK